MKIIKIIILLLIAAIMVKCKCDNSNSAEKIEINNLPNPSNTTSGIEDNIGTFKQTIFKIDNQKSIFFEVDSVKNAQNLAKIRIRTKGFDKNKEANFKLQPAVEDVFFTDLNKDGFNELFFYCKSNEAAKSSFFGITLTKDGLETIEMENPETVEKIKPEAYVGFKGYDHYKILDNEVLHVYPIHREGDKLGQSSGGSQVLIFKFDGKKLSFSSIMP